MGKKNRSKKQADPGNAQGFGINPFAGLSADELNLPKEEKKTPVTPPQRSAAGTDDLSRADRELLEAMGDATLTFAAPDVFRGTVSMQIQRKGKGGKTVTRVLGLNAMTVEEEMDLLGRLKRELGTGASCREGVVELQGDQRERCRNWFAKNKYRVKN